MGIRDSKFGAESPVLAFTAEWKAFTAGVRDSEFAL
ncbi:DUF397 domain-containing protein [Pseudonocardia sp.]